MKTAVVLALLVALAAAQKLNIWGSTDDTKRQCWLEDDRDFYSYQGRGHGCGPYHGTTNPQWNDLAQPFDDDGTVMPGWGYQIESYNLAPDYESDGADNVGFSFHLESVGEVGPSTTDFITHLGGLPACNNTAVGRASGKSHAYPFATHKWTSPGCGCEEFPVGNYDTDCNMDCESYWRNQDQAGYRTYTGGFVSELNTTVCETGSFAQLFFGYNAWSIEPQYFRRDSDLAAGTESDEAAARNVASRASDTIDQNNYWKQEAANLEQTVALYDYPLSSPNNRYRFRFRIEAKGVDADSVIYSEDKFWDTQATGNLVVRSLPLRNQPCRQDGPPIEGVEIECTQFEPQFQMTVTLKDQSVTPQLQGLRFLYGDAVNNDPSVYYSGGKYGDGKGTLYNAWHCSAYCQQGAAGQDAEVFFEHYGAVHYANIVVPSAPDASCGACSGGSDTLRGIALDPFRIVLSGSTANTASMLLVAFAALAAFMLAL